MGFGAVGANLSEGHRLALAGNHTRTRLRPTLANANGGNR